MITILKGTSVEVHWRIIRTENKITEDFTGAELRVFLVGPDNVYPLECGVEAVDGYNEIRFAVNSKGLSTGVYDLKAVWVKNKHSIPDVVNNQFMSVSRRGGVLAVTNDPSEVTPLPPDKTIKLMSYVESYGRDGMSAYELAAFRGVLPKGMSEAEWANQENVRMQNEAERKSAEDARREAEGEREENERLREEGEAGRVMTEATREAAEGVREATFQTNEAAREAEFGEAIQAAKDNLVVVNDLTTGGADKALSAEMGKELGLTLEQIASVVYITSNRVDNTRVTLEQGTYTIEGIETGSTTRLRTQLIECNLINKLRVKDGFKIVQAFYFDDAKNFIKRIDIVGNSYITDSSIDAKYIAFNFRKEDGSLNISLSDDIGLIVNDSVLEKIGAIEQDIAQLKGLIIKTESVDFSSEGYWNVTTGEYISSLGYCKSEKIPIQSVISITINTRAQSNAAGVAYYDANGAFISGFNTNYGDVVNIISSNFPQNAYYVAFSKSTAASYIDGYVELKKTITEGEKSNIGVDVYKKKKLVTIGSSSTYPGEWQKYLSDWLGLEFNNKENQEGVGYVRIENAETFWNGLEYLEEAPANAQSSTIDVFGTSINVFIDDKGQLWRKAFQMSKGGDYLVANNKYNLFSRAFDIKWYNPNVVFIMCYNEINYINVSTQSGLGSITDSAVSNPNQNGTIYGAYKGLIEFITKNIPKCEIVLVSTKLNSYAVYGENVETMEQVRDSERYKKDKIYHDAVKEIAEYYGVKFIDLLYNTGQTPWSIVEYMQDLTNVHCNNLGQKEYIANNIYKQFMS